MLFLDEKKLADIFLMNFNGRNLGVGPSLSSSEKIYALLSSEKMLERFW